MSTGSDGQPHYAFLRAQEALERLLKLQRQVKACADALKAVAQDVRAYEQIAREYVALLDKWDQANALYAEANAVLLKTVNEHAP